MICTMENIKKMSKFTNYIILFLVVGLFGCDFLANQKSPSQNKRIPQVEVVRAKQQEIYDDLFKKVKLKIAKIF